MPDNENDWTEITGITGMGVDGKPVVGGRVFFAPVGTPLPPRMLPPSKVNLHGFYLPCHDCHYPAVIAVNGRVQVPPGGIVLQWEDGDQGMADMPLLLRPPVVGGSRRQRITPHAAGCVHATAYATDSDNGRLYLPPDTIRSQVVEINGVRFGDDS